MIKAGIVGATGYVGAELVRLLAQHPQAQLSAVSSVSFEGKPLSDVYPMYRELCDMECGSSDEVIKRSDVVFAALPHGLSQELAAQCIAAGKVLIDMGADFRLKSEEAYHEWYGGTFLDPKLHEQAVYGLPEFFRERDPRENALLQTPDATPLRCRWRLLLPLRTALWSLLVLLPTAKAALRARGAA